MVKKWIGRSGSEQPKPDNQPEVVLNQLEAQEQPRDHLEIVEQLNQAHVEPESEVAEQDQAKEEDVEIPEESDEEEPIELRILTCKKSLRATIVKQLARGLSKQEMEHVRTLYF